MDDLGQFLTDRYDEAEALARDSDGYLDSGTPEELATDLSHFTWRGKSIAPSSIAYIAMHRPQDRLADIKLKRAILALHHPDNVPPHWCTECSCKAAQNASDCFATVDWPCETVRQLGTEFTGHPDYKQGWAPE